MEGVLTRVRHSTGSSSFEEVIKFIIELMVLVIASSQCFHDALVKTHSIYLY